MDINIPFRVESFAVCARGEPLRLPASTAEVAFNAIRRRDKHQEGGSFWIYPRLFTRRCMYRERERAVYRALLAEFSGDLVPRENFI